MSKKWIIIIVLLAVAGVAAWLILKPRKKAEQIRVTEEVAVTRGNITISIATTGTVQPQNRLELKPAVAGRIEKILVNEGDDVKAGDTVAWMSSSERAAILDAAKALGKQDMQQWEEAYKPTPMIAPIEGKVIVRSVEPGQTISAQESVIVIADRLIVKALVDETDIGRVSLDQEAVVTLDAYPDSRVDATVDHIAYESTTFNNVTIYEVDVLPAEVPAFFRSGMSATVDIVEKRRENVLVLPNNAVQRTEGNVFVYVHGRNGKPVKRDVEPGMADEFNVEIVKGLSEKDSALIVTITQADDKDKQTTNPFMPFPRGRGGRGRDGRVR